MGAAWDRLKDKDNIAIVGASVNPGVLEPLEHVVHQVAGQRIAWVGREIDLPIKVLTENPEETGVDRIVNIAAAYEQMGKACVVVDAGTAVTVEMYAKRKGWDIGDVEVDVDYEPAQKGSPTKFTMAVRLPKELPEEQSERLMQIAAKCPVHRTLEGEVMFSERVERIPAPARAA